MEIGAQLVQHPAYSPDLTHPEYSLLSNRTEMAYGGEISFKRRYNSEDDIIAKINNYFKGFRSYNIISPILLYERNVKA